MHFEAETGILDIKRREPCILFISLSIGLLFKLAIMSNYLFVCQFSVIGDIIQKVQCHHYLIKAYAVR